MPGLEFSFDTEPIIAWRVWKYHRPMDDPIALMTAVMRMGVTDPKWLRKPRLAAVGVRSTWWENVRMEAECVRDDPYDQGDDGEHEAPDAACECGIWALKTRKQAIQKMGTSSANIYGTVALWGRFVGFNGGWRAQYAYPQELWFRGVAHEGVKEKLERQADEIGKLYCIPTHVELLKPPRPRKRTTSVPFFSNANHQGIFTSQNWNPNPLTVWPNSIIHPSELPAALGFVLATYEPGLTIWSRNPKQ